MERAEAGSSMLTRVFFEEVLPNMQDACTANWNRQQDSPSNRLTSAMPDETQRCRGLMDSNTDAKVPWVYFSQLSDGLLTDYRSEVDFELLP